MEESFHFAILRISMAQILKASGFDKCKPSTLNIITDLYVQYFQLLVKTTLKHSQARLAGSTDAIQVPDVMTAMTTIQLIKPSSFESVLDPRDNVPKFESRRRIQHQNYNTKSLESFVDWLKQGDNFRVSRKLATVPSGWLYSLIEKRKIDDSDETDQDRKKRKLKEKQDFYNSFKAGGSGGLSGKRPAGSSNLLEIEEVEAKKNTDDDRSVTLTAEDQLTWLSYLAEKDIKFGHNLKFLNTSLQDQLLPIQQNRKYHPVLKDLKQQYSNFEKHISNLNKHDHIVMNVQDYYDEVDDDAQNDNAGPQPPVAQDNEERVLPSNQLIQTLPYNVKYNEVLLNDDLDQYLEYSRRHNLDDEENDDNPNGDDEHPLGPDNSFEEQKYDPHGHIDENGIIINDEGIGGDNNLMFM